MGNDTNESKSKNYNHSYPPNSLLFIMHMKAGYMDCARRYNVLEKSCGADSKEQCAQTISNNKRVVDDIISEFNQAFANNAEIDFEGQTFRFSDLEKIDILEGESRGESHTYATVFNPNT